MGMISFQINVLILNAWPKPKTPSNLWMCLRLIAAFSNSDLYLYIFWKRSKGSGIFERGGF